MGLGGSATLAKVAGRSSLKEVKRPLPALHRELVWLVW